MNSQVLLGSIFYGVMNPVSLIGGIAISLWAAFIDMGIGVKIGLFAILVAPWLIFIPTTYKDIYKQMLKSGHSEDCSKKVARLATPYASLWSNFKIMKDKDDGKRLWR